MGQCPSIPKFRSYLKQLESLESLGTVRYHLALHSVTLPDLECNKIMHCLESGNPQSSMRSKLEATEIFSYLRRQSVYHIETVKVLDCRWHPHPDNAIAEGLKGFSIRSLNWRKLDMDPCILAEVKELRELHLYSSGNECVLKYWTMPETLGSLLEVSRSRLSPILHVYADVVLASCKRS